ncbi:MAG: T9SS type A sorting domain-containing protein [Cytophagales bacterium]|nr:T9SS type A sorting domain-containing protein [Cytophagales bacterium]
MERIFTNKKWMAVLLTGLFGMAVGMAQTRVYSTLGGIPAGASFPGSPAVTERKIVYTYEGFDYYSPVLRQAVGQGNYLSSRDILPVSSIAPDPRYDIRQTVAPTPSISPLSLHNINNEVSNSEYALGWASDWLAAGGSTTYEVATRSANTTVNSPKPNETHTLVNVGSYAIGGGGNSIGRRLQTSTAGYFYEYEIWQDANQGNGTADGGMPANSFWFDGGVGSGLGVDERYSRTLPISPIRLQTGGKAHHRIGATHTMNTSIGSAGSEVWFGFLMRINSNDPSGNPTPDPIQDAYIRLHNVGNTNPGNVWDANSATKINIGFLPNGTGGAAFGTTSATRRWGLRINDVPYVATTNNGGTIAPADSSNIRPDQFTLLVTRMEFITETQTRVRLYVINNNSQWYDDGPDADSEIDIPAEPTVDVTINGVDLSFNAVAYQGGDFFGFSNIDELRFARTYDQAALATRTISVIADLCESRIDTDGIGDLPGGTPGFNVNQNGDLGSVQSTSVTAMDPTEQLGGSDPGSGDSVYDGAFEPVATAPFPVRAPLAPATDNPSPSTITNPAYSDPNEITSRVVFERGATPFNGVTYGTIAPLLLYIPNQNSRPNDGSYYVGTQSRSPFGAPNDTNTDLNGDGDSNDPGEAPFNRPIWITAYDNSGTQTGNMMVINAAYSRGEFFSQTVGGICSGTQYEFFCDILNLFNKNTKSISNLADHNNVSLGLNNYECDYDNNLEPGASQFAFAGTDLNGSSGLGAATDETPNGTCGALNPEVEILLDGVPVYIPPVTVANDEQWHRVGFTFITKNIPSGNITVSVRNRAPGGNGNDLAIDNFIFRPCGPSLQLGQDQFCPETDPASPTYANSRTVRYLPRGKTYRRPFYLWVVKRCVSNCNSPNPANRGYASDSLIVGGSAIFAAGPAQVTIDDIQNSPNFSTVFPGGTIPQGTVVLAYSASENDANTRTARCRIVGVTTYYLTDYQPLEGTSYYRLRMVNTDGTFAYSNVETVTITQQYRVYPIPADDKLIVALAEETQQTKKVNLTLYNVLGSVVMTRSQQVSMAQPSIELATSRLQPGVYMLEINDGNTKVQKRVVISR